MKYTNNDFIASWNRLFYQQIYYIKCLAKKSCQKQSTIVNVAT